MTRKEWNAAGVSLPVQSVKPSTTLTGIAKVSSIGTLNANRLSINSVPLPRMDIQPSSWMLSKTGRIDIHCALGKPCGAPDKFGKEFLLESFLFGESYSSVASISFRIPSSAGSHLTENKVSLVSQAAASCSFR